MGTISRVTCPVLEAELEFDQNLKSFLTYLKTITQFKKHLQIVPALEQFVAKYLRLSLVSDISKNN